jgi:type III restriction enzyme
MFRGSSSAYQECVDVIGNQAFIDFVDDLERVEDVKLDTFRVGKDKLTITTIGPDPATRGEYDIGLPKLSPALLRKRTLADEIAAIDMLQFQVNPLPIKPGEANERNFRYEGKDILTLETLVERDYTIPDPRTSGEVIGYYAKLIANDIKLPSQFAALVPQIRQFFQHTAFGKAVDLDDPQIISAMNRNVAAYVVRAVFKRALGHLLIEQAEPTLLVPERKLSTLYLDSVMWKTGTMPILHHSAGRGRPL